MVKFEKTSDESLESFLLRLADVKTTNKDITWQDIADNVYINFGINRSESWVRKRVREILAVASTENLLEALLESRKQIEVSTFEMRKERAKLGEQRALISAHVRKLSREETIKEIALDVAKSLSTTKFLKPYEAFSVESDCEGILCISDWHYGLEFVNPWNKFSPEICKERINRLKNKTIDYVKKYKCQRLHLVNLQDLIAGRIHLGLRLDSRYDVITQTLHVSEILAELITELSKFVNIEYYDTLDNHSRLEPNKKEAQDLETLARIIPWYLKERLKDNKRVNINENTFGYDLITFESLGHKIIGCHGDRDPIKNIDHLSMMTEQHYDMLLIAHEHHFQCNEKNKTIALGNGTLMGTDGYAQKLRLSSTPSQNFILVTKENVTEAIHRITLEQ